MSAKKKEFEVQGVPVARWYALRIYSGHERKVKESIEADVLRSGLGEKILQIYVPYERFVEVKNGKKRSLTKNAFPGYVLIEAVLDKQTRNLILDIPSVMGFLGVDDVPTPLRPDEVEKILEPESSIEHRSIVESPFKIGDSVKVTDGPFSSLTGVVHEVSTERMKVKVMISFFGRSTPTELDFSQVIKLQIPAGAANPAPPVGPALGQKGVNIMEFCKQFNAKTQSESGMIIPVVITVFSDKSFTFITKTPPAAVLLLKEASLKKGSGEPNRNKVGSVSREQVRRIAELKMPDLNAVDISGAEEMIMGTARSMGILIQD